MTIKIVPAGRPSCEACWEASRTTTDGHGDYECPFKISPGQRLCVCCKSQPACSCLFRHTDRQKNMWYCIVHSASVIVSPNMIP